jgi:secondary thiamine-phosphate synthase enzyme
MFDMYRTILKLETEHHTQLTDITDLVLEEIKKSGKENGQVLVQAMHTTTGIMVNEYEERLLKDLEYYLNEVAPSHKDYLHNDVSKRNCPEDEPPNAHSHIKAALYSRNSETISLYEGKLDLGKYQRIIFAEFDGPCPRPLKSKRHVAINILGE